MKEHGAYFDFTPDKRSLYLTSLRGKGEAMERIANQGASYLSNMPSSFRPSTSKGHKKKFDKALQILNMGIIREQSVEKQYIQNLLTGLPADIDPTTRNELNAKFSEVFNTDGAVDYNKITILINNILLGAENFESTVNYEKDRLVTVNDAYNAALAQKIETIKNGEEKIKRIVPISNEEHSARREKLYNDYLKAHTVIDYDMLPFFSQLESTIDYVLADTINRAARSVISNCFPQITAALEAGTYSQMQTNLLNNLIQECQKQTSSIIAAAKKTSNVKDIIASMTNTMVEKLNNQSLQAIQVHGNSKNFGISQKRKAMIQELQDLQQEKKYEMIGKKLTDILLEIYNDLGEEERKDNEILSSIFNMKVTYKGTTQSLSDHFTTLNQNMAELDNMLAQHEERINKLSQEMTKEEAEKKENENLKNLRSQIAARKGQLTKNIKRQLDNQINSAIDDAAREALVQKIQQSLNPSAIKISGPQLSEIVDVIRQQFFTGNNTFLPGPVNIKPDSINVQITPQPTSKSLQTNKITAAANAIMNQEAKTFYDTFVYGNDDESGVYKPGKSFSLKIGKHAWYNAVEAMQKKVTAKMKQRNFKGKGVTAKKMKAIADQLQNTIIVTTTMKTFINYNNDIGFLSGSLGGNILDQVSNFNELFSSAGIPLSDQEIKFLETALVNCSGAALGAGLKGPLEKFLSTLAGFAMFDEGSAELEMIVQQSQTQYVPAATPKIMHLYRLNGMYFTGSYVLQRVYDYLKETTAKIEEEVNDSVAHDGAKIRAVADDSLISHGDSNLSDRWSMTYAKAASSEYTSVSFAFLSDLLGVVNQLSDAMSSF